MTKNIKRIISLVIMTTAFAFVAAAQAPSLADVGHDIYRSEADGFEIAVPHQCVKVTSADGLREYRCDSKEGLIKVMVNPVSHAVKTDADIADFTGGFKKGLLEDPGIKILGETGAQIGSYRGAAYQLMMGNDKTIMIALAWETFEVVIIGRADSRVANSAELIGAGVQSFTFVAPTQK
jgi:hypothetical protein